MYDYKKGLQAMAVCYFIWGFQPLYYAIDNEIDTFFLLCCRIIWAAICCLIILKIQGKISLLTCVFKDSAVLKREVPAAFLLLADWGIYLYAVRNGRVLECSMGYYIMPLVMFMLGAFVFKEKVNWRHFAVLIFVVAGIILSINGFGRFPYVTVLLSLCFAIYSGIKKSLTVDSVVSTSAEIIILVPLALIYIILFCRGENGLLSLTFSRLLFIIGSGIVTAVPMVCFSVGLKYLPLTFTSIIEYTSPTLGIFCSLILGETLSSRKLLSFIFIWIGVALYIFNLLYENKKRSFDS